MSDPDWTFIVREYQAIGMWHALQWLKTTSIKDPFEVAQDAMQETWIRLMRRGIRKGDSVKGLVIVHAISAAKNLARSNHPIGTIRTDSKRGRGRRHKADCKCAICEARATIWPTQIFGGYIGEVTIDEEIIGPYCGDE